MYIHCGAAKPVLAFWQNHYILQMPQIASVCVWMSNQNGCLHTPTCLGLCTCFILMLHLCVFRCVCALESTEWLGICFILNHVARRRVERGPKISFQYSELLPQCFSHIDALENCNDFFFYKPEPFSNLTFLVTASSPLPSLIMFCFVFRALLCWWRKS